MYKKYRTRLSSGDKAAAVMAIGFISLIVAGIAGWVLNIVQVFTQMPATFGEATPMWVLKIVGIFFAPAGAILGWIGLF